MRLVLERKDGDHYETPYNKPEAYGFEHVAEIQWGWADYSFDLTAVLRRKSDGTLWYASDSGCSCPSPFEDVYEWERLYNLDPLAPGERTQPDLSEYRKFLADVVAAFARLKEEK